MRIGRTRQLERPAWVVHATGWYRMWHGLPMTRPCRPGRLHGMTDAPDLTAEQLLLLGRDREAVEAALAGWHREVRPDTSGGPDMDGVQQLDEVIPLLRQVVGGLTPDQHDRCTPCTDFTVAGVLEHMIGGATAFAPGFRGAPASGGPAAGDVVQRWEAAIADLLDSVHSPGAQERILATPFGEQSGASFARYVAFDGLMHGWDLSTATGQAYAPRDELVAAVDAYARELLVPEMRDGDTFAAEQPVGQDASALERLVAFSGRNVPAG